MFSLIYARRAAAQPGDLDPTGKHASTTAARHHARSHATSRQSDVKSKAWRKGRNVDFAVQRRSSFDVRLMDRHVAEATIVDACQTRDEGTGWNATR